MVLCGWSMHGAPAVVPGFEGDGGVNWICGPGGGVKRVRLNSKTPAHLVRHGSVLFLDELLLLFRYPASSGAALLAGTLPLRYCRTGYASRVPTWSLPSPGRGHGISGRL